MERTFPQKVKPVPSCEVEDGVMASQIRQAPLEVNRRVRTSAAMIGLAISMGAYSLPLPNQSDEAVAAEPVAGEATATTLPAEFDVATVAPNADVTNLTSTNPTTAGVIEHTVQEGQTLWQLAQFYQVNASDVASANGISINAVLHVGQVLKIPTRGQSVVLLGANGSTGSTPEYYGTIGQVTAAKSEVATSPKVQQSAALEALRQKQADLRSSLAKLQSNRATAETVPQPVAASPTPSAGEVSYRVLPGDTLSAIASAHHISLAKLAAANDLANPNVLRVNQELTIPTVTAESLSDSTPTALSVNLPVMVASANPDQMSLPKSVGLKGTAETRSPSKTTTITALPVQPPVENQALPAVSLNHSATVATVKGNTEVATNTFIPRSQAVDAGPVSAGSQYSYVEGLRLEIVKLREKYQDSASRVQPNVLTETKVATASLNATVPTVEPAVTAASSELKPSRYTRALQEQIRRLQASRQQSKAAEMRDAAVDLAPVASQSQPKLVATASIGSQSYEPLIPNSVGQMVSPSLPPLGSVDAYLPGNTGKFNGYIWPAKGVLTSGFGYRWGRLHKGIDIAAPVGTPVVAAAAGVVITAGWNSGGYGNMVEIQHPDGSVTLYAHNSRILVHEGQEVAQGQQIADMGSTGYSTGPHSHFEVHLPGQGAVNPMAHLPRAQA